MPSLHSLCHNPGMVPTVSTWRRIREYPWPLIFLLGNGFGVLLFLYKTLDGVARQDPVDWLAAFVPVPKQHPQSQLDFQPRHAP